MQKINEPLLDQPGEKKQLRRIMRQRRRALPEKIRQFAAKRLIQFVKQSGFLQRYQKFGFYFPAQYEINCLPLLNELLFLKKQCFLPQIHKRYERLLYFSLLTQKKQNWYLNRYQILEYASETRLRARQLDVLLMPLVAFDEVGFRLGMGGGYYDKTLAYLKQRRFWKKPIRVGLAFECQKVQRLIPDPWDIPLDYVITEKKIYRFHPRESV